MIRALRFNAGGRAVGEYFVRESAYVAQSTLPLSAACLVANGVRERLSQLLAAELDVDLVEATIPNADERRVLVEDAHILRVRGRLCDGLVVVRQADARRIVALAFGETGRSDVEPLSEIERVTLDRVIGGLVPLCNALCGTLGPVVAESSDRAACDLATYFEVRTTGSVKIAIGFALTRDPPQEVGERITLADLADVELEATVELGSGTLTVPAFSRLCAGASIVLDTPLAAPGTLCLGDVRFARGTCGASAGRSAIGFEAFVAA